MAGATSSPIWRQVPGAAKFSFEEISGPNPYAGGGFLADSSLFSGFSRVDVFFPLCTNSLQWEAAPDVANNKIKLFDRSTKAESGAVDQSSVKIYCLVIGR